jgi:hypothetical protein
MNVENKKNREAAYKRDCVQGKNICVETQALGDTAQFLSNVLCISRLGAIDNKGTTRLRGGGHGGGKGKGEGLRRR